MVCHLLKRYFYQLSIQVHLSLIKPNLKSTMIVVNLSFFALILETAIIKLEQYIFVNHFVNQNQNSILNLTFTWWNQPAEQQYWDIRYSHSFNLDFEIHFRIRQLIMLKPSNLDNEINHYRCILDLYRTTFHI